MSADTARRLISDADISAAEAVSIADIATVRGFVLKKSGHELIGPCPRCCGGTDRFAINTAKQLFNCRVCSGKGRGAISFVMFLEDVGFRDAVEMLIGRRFPQVRKTRSPTRTSGYKTKVGFVTLRNLTPDIQNKSRFPSATNTHLKPSPTNGKRRNSADDERHQQFALDLWRQAGPADATPVEIYLHPRGLRPPSPDVVRFHPRCPFGQDANGRTIYTPVMLALVRNIVSNEPQAVHRTALDRHGNKVEFIGQDGKPRSRMALGKIQGGAVKLTDDAEVTKAKAVGIGEGIETTLSLQQLPEWFGSPVWSLLSKNGVRDFPVLSGIATLMVAVDHDEKQDGQKAATAAAARWRAAGCEVLLAWPTTPGDDVNDVVRERAS